MTAPVISTEQIALWAGLISSVVSIVLSVVAIVFAVLVDRSARQVTAQTIKSLQKIESDVERSSGDTRELIKAAWEKMLGSVAIPESSSVEAAAKEIASGLASELRADFAQLTATKPGADDLSHRMTELLDRLENSLSAQIKAEVAPETAGSLLDQARSMLMRLSPEARALATEIAKRHVSRKRYAALMSGPMAKPLAELRDSGVLVPVKGFDKEGHALPVYYFPSRLAKAIRAALSLFPATSEDIRETAKRELSRVGYYEDI